MLDFLLGAVIVALAIRGWWRGLLREAIAFGVVVVGLLVAFRLSTPAGNIFESTAGVSPEVGRLVAGVLIYLALSIGAAIASSVLHKGLRFVPGLPTVNRAAGAGVSIAATVAVATIALSLLTVVSPPDAVTSQIEGSSLAGFLTDPDQLPQKAMGVVSGDRSLERLLNLREVVGTQRVVADETAILLASTPESDIEVDGDAGAELVEMINRSRDAEGAGPLVESGPLAALALRHAEDVYVTGRFGSDGSDGTSFEDRLADAGIPVVAGDQVMALALTAEAAQEALLGDPGSDALYDPAYRRVGVAVVKGPLGTLVVEVVAG